MLKNTNIIKFKVKFSLTMSGSSLNFSKISDRYIPKLIQLNSYWRNAMEEAIQDTLQGEKRLYYAVKNRKKVKQKLEKLGLKSKPPLRSFKSGKFCPSRNESYAAKHPCNKIFFEGEEYSEEEKSRSRSKVREETPQRYHKPEKPLLGDGSLEKMKKSQNDFNFEPMGVNEGKRSPMSTSEYEKEEEDEGRQYRVRIPENEFKTPNKNIKWIHVRENSHFDDSDSEMSHVSKKGVLEKNDFKQIPRSRANVMEKNQRIPINLDPRGDLFWENEVKNAIRVNSHYERKLQFALAKREILNEHQASLRIDEGDDQIELQESVAKTTDKRWRGKKFLSPFVRFYLDVYRELCLKSHKKEIGEEAVKRWCNMSMKQKSNYSSRKSKK